MNESSLADDVARYEAGAMDAQEIVQFFQDLVDTGLVCRLSHEYAQTASVLTWAGLVVKRTECREGARDSRS